MQEQLLTVGLIQQRNTNNIAANLINTLQKIREAVAKGAKLVVLQELHASLYFCQQEDSDYFDLAETIPGPSTDKLSQLAKELGIVLVASIFEKRAKGLYHNTAVVFEQDGRIAGTYRKMHIPDDPGFYEKYYFTPGDQGFIPIKTSVGCLGVLVCWDQWFPEAARLMTLAGADLLIYPTAIGWDNRDNKAIQQSQLNAWQIVQQSHAITNHLPVVSCNRVGFEADPNDTQQGIDFWGNSFICGAQGNLLAQAAHQDEAVLVATVDLAETESLRRTWPYLRDRRIDHYQGLGKIYL